MTLFAPEPMTVADAGVEESMIAPRLMPANPPRKLSEVPATDPDEVELLMMLPFAPTNPPMTLLGPVLVTDPDALDNVIKPNPLSPSPAPLTPTSPPKKLLAPPLTAPLAKDSPWSVAPIMPLLPPARPPARLPEPTVTLPLAFELMRAAKLLWPSPSVQPLQLLLSKPALLPTSPPAWLLSP